MRRSQSSGSLHTSASRDGRSARSVRSSTSKDASSVGGATTSDSFAPRTIPGRYQIFVEDPSVRAQEVHGYKRSEFGGGFVWSAPERLHDNASLYSQQPLINGLPAPNYGFKDVRDQPLKENCSRSNPNMSGPGYSRNTYGGF